MALDLTQLKKHREMIDTILRLAEDPDAAPLLEKLVVEKAASQPRIEPASRIKPDAEERASDSHRGAQVAAVRKAVAARSGIFTVGNIGDDLRGMGMDIDNISVGRVLKRLADKNSELSIAVRGIGSEPNQYQKTDRFRAA